MNDAQTQLLERLREIVQETPLSGAVDAGNRPLRISYVSRAVEARADDGPALVAYVKSKIHAKPTNSYVALIEAGRPDLTTESVAADPDAPWASEFDDHDRAVATERLGTMLAAKREADAAIEAAGVDYDRKIVANLNERRIAAGKPELTPEQEHRILTDRAADRQGVSN